MKCLGQPGGWAVLAAALWAAAALVVMAPAGAAAEEVPALPPGLTGGPQEPGLPPGLAEEAPAEEEEAEEAPVEPPFEVSGFYEVRVGFRTQRDPFERSLSLGETRLELVLERLWDRGALRLTADFVYDPVLGRHSLRLEEGEGFLDLREANLTLRVTPFMDLKAGRQVLTWGTGDLLFLNDLFPKDWQAFFIGRDVDYLKAPSDALKVALFSDLVNLDLVYTPRFDADRFLWGHRLSFFNPALGRTSGRDAVIKAELRRDWFSEDELAWRLYRNLGPYEVAGYGYLGFWKSPAGLDPGSGRATFPRLQTYGASVRGPLGRGIGNLEVAFYDSQDDLAGTDPLVRNSEWRFLAGYEQEVARDFTVGLQYYLEWMQDYPRYRRSLPPGVPRADEVRHLLTLRLTKLLLQQNLTLSLFTFYSPSDNDAYLRPRLHYRIDDQWSVEVGGNVFLGDTSHTFFGQFRRDTNLYAGVRYSF